MRYSHSLLFYGKIYRVKESIEFIVVGIEVLLYSSDERQPKEALFL